MSNTREQRIEKARREHLDALVALENRCFTSDKIHRRSFKHWLTSEDTVFLVLLDGDELAGYGLALCNRGTKLARLYSIAVSPDFQKQGIASRLLEALEDGARQQQRLFMRLEVARHNTAAYQLYEKVGYRVFGEYTDYYQNHDDAIRMQKTIYKAKDDGLARTIPWYQQTTEFTCGPAALMMAMSHNQKQFVPAQNIELDIWREANTIFMTSGHGGTHPFGLAIAAHQRGYEAQVLVNNEGTLFLDGVRSEHKKEIMSVVHNRFLEQANAENIAIHYQAPTIGWIQQQMAEGFTILVLISTYRMDKKKTPHWVAVTHVDDRCIFVHDPDVSDDQLAVDSQHVPIALEDFDKMTAFGKQKLKTAIAIRPLQ